MATHPEPLIEGTLLAERFSVRGVLGRGGFGITYLCDDDELGGSAAVKELAPSGVRRLAGGLLELAEVGEGTAQRLRFQFVEEAKTLARVRVPAIPQVRGRWIENGTAYFAMDYVDDATPLDHWVSERGPLSSDEARALLEALLKPLEALHSIHVLHRDVKPSNILVRSADEVYLIDFGSARQWHADLTRDHTVQFTPGYAPIEQLSERARRGPASDLYGLGATLYHALTGDRPPSAEERAAGAELPNLKALRSDLPEELVEAIQRCLEFRAERRPQTVGELRDDLNRRGEGQGESVRVLALDAKRSRVQSMRPKPCECPACGGVLDRPKPLKRGVCPVCREDRLRPTSVVARRCPCCSAGVLSTRDNSGPLRYCPSCKTGRLRREGGLLKRSNWTCCEACGFRLETLKDHAREPDGEWLPLEHWRGRSGRAEKVQECDACQAQFDPLPDGRLRQVNPIPERDAWHTLSPDEWAQVAAGREPGSGNLECPSCGAGFFAEDGNVTLLGGWTRDPFGFGERYLGRLLAERDLATLGVGKLSGSEGLLCETCGTEFDDTDGSELVLVSTDHRLLAQHVDAAYTTEDWHRIAQGLPLEGQEEQLDEQIGQALVDGYRVGEIPFDPDDADLLWRGPAQLVVRSSRQPKALSGTLEFREETVRLGGWFRRRTVETSKLRRAEAAGDALTLEFDDRIWELTVDPVELTFRLESGRDRVVLDAECLAARLAPIIRENDDAEAGPAEADSLPGMGSSRS